MTRTLVRVVARDDAGNSFGFANIAFNKKGTGNPISDSIYAASSGGAPLVFPQALDGDGVFAGYVDLPGSDVPGEIDAVVTDSGAVRLGGVGDVVAIASFTTTISVRPSARGHFQWPLTPGGNDPIPQQLWYVNKFTGKDSGDAGYCGDGMAGVTPDKAFRTIAGATAKLPANARACLVLGGGAITDITTMLATPANYHVYECDATLVLDNTHFNGVIGRGISVNGDKACTLIVDSANLPTDVPLIEVLATQFTLVGFIAVNRKAGGDGFLFDGSANHTLMGNAGAWGCARHGLVVRGNGHDCTEIRGFDSMKNAGFGLVLDDAGAAGTANAKLPNATVISDCNISQNTLGQIKQTSATSQYLDSGNTLSVERNRLHYHGVYGKVFIEGGHNAGFRRNYCENTSAQAKDTAMFIVRGPRYLNGPQWAPGLVYAAGAIVRGLTRLGAECYFSSSGGTSGGAEPAWDTSAVGAQTLDNGMTWTLVVPTGPTVWAAARQYNVGDCVIATTFTGKPGTGVAERIFQCTVAGVSGGGEPAWATGGATADGGVTWNDMGRCWGFLTRGITFEENDANGWSISGMGWTAGKGRQFDLDWCVGVAIKRHQARGAGSGNALTTANPVVLVGAHAFATEIEVLAQQLSGLDWAGTSQGLILNDLGIATVGRYFDGALWQEINPGGWAGSHVSLTDGASIPLAMLASRVFRVVMNGSNTIARPTGLQTGWPFLLVIKNGTGGNITPAYDAVFKLPAASAVLATTKSRMVLCVYDGTNVLAVPLGDM